MSSLENTDPSLAVRPRWPIKKNKTSDRPRPIGQESDYESGIDTPCEDEEKQNSKISFQENSIKKSNTKTAECHLDHTESGGLITISCNFVNCHKIQLLVFLCIGTIFVGWVLSKPVGDLSAKIVTRERIKKFNAMLLKAKSDFANQSDVTWRIFNKSIKHLLEMVPPNEPRQSVMLTVLGTGGDRKYVNCLSKRIQSIVSEIVDNRQHCDQIKAQSLPNTDENSLKQELEYQIKDNLDRPCHAIVVEDIDHLNRAGLMLLQPYADDTSAHRDVIIILTATTEEDFPKVANMKHFAKLARDHFNTEWKDEHDDYRSAWLSRFLQYVAVAETAANPEKCESEGSELLY